MGSNSGGNMSNSSISISSSRGAGGSGELGAALWPLLAKGAPYVTRLIECLIAWSVAHCEGAKLHSVGQLDDKGTWREAYAWAYKPSAAVVSGAEL
jgi:hypothetical protein